MVSGASQRPRPSLACPGIVPEESESYRQMDKAFLVGVPSFLSSQFSRGSGEVSLCLMTQLLSLAGTQGEGSTADTGSGAHPLFRPSLQSPAERGVGFVSKWTVLRLV